MTETLLHEEQVEENGHHERSVEDAAASLAAITDVVQAELPADATPQTVANGVDRAVADLIHDTSASTDPTDTETALEVGAVEIIQNVDFGAEAVDDTAAALGGANLEALGDALRSIESELGPDSIAAVMSVVDAINHDAPDVTYKERSAVAHSQPGWEQLGQQEVTRESRLALAQAWLDAHTTTIGKYEFAQTVIDETADMPPDVASEIAELVAGSYFGSQEHIVKKALDAASVLRPDLFGVIDTKALVEHRQKITDVKKGLEGMYTDAETGAVVMDRKASTLLNIDMLPLVVEMTPELLDDEMAKQILEDRNVTSHYRQNNPNTFHFDAATLYMLGEATADPRVTRFAEMIVSDHPEDEAKHTEWVCTTMEYRDPDGIGRYQEGRRQLIELSRQNAARAEELLVDSSFDDDMKRRLRKYTPDIRSTIGVVEASSAYHSDDADIQRMVRRLFDADFGYSKEAIGRLDAIADGLDGRLLSSLEKIRRDYVLRPGSAETIPGRFRSFEEIDALEVRKSNPDLVTLIDGYLLGRGFGDDETFADRLAHARLFEDQAVTSLIDDEAPLADLRVPLAELLINAEDYQQVLARLDDDTTMNLVGAESPFSKMRVFVMNQLLTAHEERYDQLLDILADQKVVYLLSDGSPLAAIQSQLMRLLLHSENHHQQISRLTSLLESGDISLWRLNTEYAQLLLGEVGEGSISGYRVDTIPVALPLGNRGTYDAEIDDEAMRPVSEMDREELLMYMTESAAEGVLAGEGLSFNQLNLDTRTALLSRRLFESIAKSRGGEAVGDADERNREMVLSGAELWRAGSLVHATKTPGAFRSILTNGLLCGETLGTESNRDTYPFNVDFVSVSSDVMREDGFQEKVHALKNRSYGPIAMMFHRNEGSTDYGRETIGGMNHDHRLVFGAVPSTEMSGVVLRDASDQQRDEVIAAVVEHGMYVPVYSEEGEILLVPDQFDDLRSDGNFDAVTPEIVDNSFKREGTQSGSNEGAWFIVPKNGETEHWYVKFGDMSLEKTTHTWTELLTDELYRRVTPELVPETKALVVEGRFSRGAKEVSVAEQDTVTNEARNAGAVMDWYVGNWDAVYNDANLVMTTDGRAMRIDTGNSLDFRARGDRKGPGQFGPHVQEAEFGTNNDQLGGGMRQMYPGLSDEEIRAQVVRLQETLPDEVIDTVVDGIRRSRDDREGLKVILKQRRDDLVKRFLSNHETP